MSLECFTWITQLLGSLVHKLRHKDEGIFTRLPDCLIIDILSRLPEDCLVRCQRDCRVWKALISSQYFATLYLRRAKPVLIIQCDRGITNHEQNLFVFDESLNNKEKITFRKVLLKRELMINKVNKLNPLFRYSCQGVLLFMDVFSPPTYFIFNPITQEEVTVQHKFHPGYLCAFYYCSLTREFKLLYAREEGSHECQYFIYTVRTQTWRKIHSPTSNFLPRVSPAVVNGAVHLIVSKDLVKPNTPPCANGIMVLKIDKEELSIMPHPGSVCSSWKTHHTMSLLVKEECLSFCQLLIFENAMDIWILEDYETWVWTKRFKVNLVFNNQGIDCSLPFGHTYWEVILYMSWQIEPLDFLEGELVLYWYNRGLFMYNMDHNNLRKIEGPQGSKRFTCMPYIKSLLTIA
ncbi:F-box protein At3g07870-like [Nicotiana tabacum]|uniref:F-box protein At3g07870-like n=2 Tax=Nicotiana TaxID=4085 RepID=A0A1S3Z1H3_TOBAC|nr:PREDICTED: F-box protein At3g07870-like isoform X1 [Nicotiana sylvestris]XP_016458279.1 PREDICTED: F-box protein At3g07870-like [Nicotiana tabacum]